MRDTIVSLVLVTLLLVVFAADPLEAAAGDVTNLGLSTESRLVGDSHTELSRRGVLERPADDGATPGSLDQVMAWLTLVVLVLTFIVAVQRVYLYRLAWWPADAPGLLRETPNWFVLAAGLVGLVIAGYLAYNKLTNSSIACGPLGGCNTVQASRYSLLLGIPMGLWGVFAYASVVILWGVGSFGQGPAAQWSRPLLLGLSLFCVLFSLYLTALELFVIQATCTWCVGSALTTAVLAWLLTRDRAWLPLEVNRKPRKRRKMRR